MRRPYTSIDNVWWVPSIFCLFLRFLTGHRSPGPPGFAPEQSCLLFPNTSTLSRRLRWEPSNTETRLLTDSVGLIAPPTCPCHAAEDQRSSSPEIINGPTPEVCPLCAEILSAAAPLATSVSFSRWQVIICACPTCIAVLLRLHSCTRAPIRWHHYPP